MQLYFGFIGLFLSTFAASAVLAEPACDWRVNRTVPDGWQEASNYQHLESNLQVFTHYRVPCDGAITGWRYMTPHSAFHNVIFAVLRQVDADQDGPVFKIVGATLVKDQPRDWYPGAWITANVNSIGVLAGDYLGLFYKTRSLADNEIMIPSQDLMGTDHATTLLYPLDASNIMSNTVKGPYRMKQRMPAFHAIISNDAPTTPPPTTTTTTTMAAPRQRTWANVACYGPAPDLTKQNPFCQTPHWRAFFDSQVNTCVAFYGCQPASANAMLDNNFDSLSQCNNDCVNAFPWPDPSIARRRDGSEIVVVPADRRHGYYSPPQYQQYQQQQQQQQQPRWIGSWGLSNFGNMMSNLQVLLPPSMNNVNNNNNNNNNRHLQLQQHQQQPGFFW